MATRSSKLRSWVYALGLLFIILCLAIVPAFVQKKHFIYTLTGSPATSTDKLDLEREFVRVTRQGAAEKTTLAKIAKGEPGGLLVNFWATWCPPCLEELPSLEQLSRQLAARNDPNLPKLVTLSVDERVSDILGLHKTLSFKPTFTVLHDPSAAYSESIGTVRFPETYWVGPDGKIRFKWLGPQDWLSDSVLRRLASPTADTPAPVLK